VTLAEDDWKETRSDKEPRPMDPKNTPPRTRMGPLRIRPGRAYVGQSPEESTLAGGRFRAILFALNIVIALLVAKGRPVKRSRMPKMAP